MAGAPWHILTGEYPPRPGGVSDYSAHLSGGLARAGAEVHVWAPAAANGADARRRRRVRHRLTGAWSRPAWPDSARRSTPFASPRGC